MTHDVFISYASEDKSAADTARAALEAQGISCWIAPRDVLPGEDETEAILTAIDTSVVVVLCLSSAANASKLVTQQAGRAFNKNIPIVPLRIEDVEPSNALKLFLGSQEPVDAYTPPLEAHLGALAEIVGSFLAEAAAPTAGVLPPSGPPYGTAPSAARERRGGAPPHAGRRVAVIAVLVVVAFVVIAGLFVLLPRSQLQPIAVSSKTPKESPTPSGEPSSPSAEPTVLQPAAPTEGQIIFPTESPTVVPTESPSVSPTPTLFPTATPSPTVTPFTVLPL